MALPQLYFCNTLRMCVAYSCIDVQIQLENASLETCGSIRAAAPGHWTFAASGLQAGSPQPASRASCLPPA